jgi:hypothetical protein
MPTSETGYHMPGHPLHISGPLGSRGPTSAVAEYFILMVFRFSVIASIELEVGRIGPLSLEPHMASLKRQAEE